MQAKLVLDADDLIAGRIGRHDEGGDALLAGIGIGDGEDDDDMAVLARGDELLGAVEHIVIAVAARAGAQVGGVGAGLRLGQRKAADPFAARKLRQEALLLLLGAEFQDRHAADRAVDAHDGRARPVAGGDFLEGHGIGDGAGVRAAIGFRHQHAEQAEFAHLLQLLAWERHAIAVAVGRTRRQPLAGEVAGQSRIWICCLGQDHVRSSRPV